MAMFNQKDEMGDPNIDTLIGSNTRFEGDIRFKGGLHIDGEVEGSVVADGSGLLVISEQGRVKGEIDVPEVIVDGQVDGDITASNRLELRENGRVGGNIKYGSIRMALGAQVNGNLAYESNPSAPRSDFRSTKDKETSSGSGS
ncbi:MAG: polymer-forming cytoskeletal protein [Xanthomonadales bacterium]|nr:polymer-forming cytoskeletal protein [Xanthomonadales bacterium]